MLPLITFNFIPVNPFKSAPASNFDAFGAAFQSAPIGQNNVFGSDPFGAAAQPSTNGFGAPASQPVSDPFGASDPFGGASAASFDADPFNAATPARVSTELFFINHKLYAWAAFER